MHLILDFHTAKSTFKRSPAGITSWQVLCNLYEIIGINVNRILKPDNEYTKDMEL